MKALSIRQPWAHLILHVGPWGFVLDEVKPLPFQPCKGALGFFTPQLGGQA